MKKFLPTLMTLQTGDRVVVPKSNIRLVQHHAIYIGTVNGQHRFIENKEGYGVREVSAEVFFKDVYEITRIEKFHPRANYSRSDLVSYARRKKGKSYNLLNYNCEHAANEIQNHVIKSKQANTGVGIALFGLATLLIGGMLQGGDKK